MNLGTGLKVVSDWALTSCILRGISSDSGIFEIESVTRNSTMTD